jgi:ATP-binding cassette, subfamily B, bacterial PglK
LGPAQKKLSWLAGLFLLNSLLDLIGIGLVGPFIALVLDPGVLLEGEFWKNLPILGPHADHATIAWVIGGTLAFVFFAKMIAGVAITRVILRFGREQEIALRMMLVSAYLQMPYENYLRRNSAEYVHSIISLTSVYATGVLTPLLKIAADGAVAIAILFFLAFSSPIALFGLVGVVGGLIIGYDRLVRRRGESAGKRANDAGVGLVKAVNEMMRGLKELRILGKEQVFSKEIFVISQEYAHQYLRMAMFSAIPRYLLEFALVLFVILFALSAVGMKAGVDRLVVTLSIFGVAALRLIPAATMLSKSLTDLRINRDSVERLQDEKKRLVREIQNLGDPSKSFNDRIRFEKLALRGIYFRYADAKSYSLEGLSLTLNAGESIGICGPSGSGKTTLVDVMLGLLEPTRGDVYFNEQKLDYCLDEWCSHVAYLPQTTFLIDAGLHRNVALGVPEKEIDLERVEKALGQAQMNSYVMELPNGIKTHVGEHGVKMSGGQRQRVALARAFYHGRDVLIMDEGTNALDEETEAIIIDEVFQFRGKRTLIVITHQLSTLRHCDRIYQVDNGRIISEGDYSEVVT